MKKRLTVLALAFAMVLTMSASVFATQATDGTLTGKSVAVTKELNVAEGVTLPTEQFKFNVKKGTTKDSFTSHKEYVSDTTQYADIAFAPITVAEADRGTTTPEKIVKESTVDLTNASFARAGLFVYEVKEDGSAATDGMTYDTNTYYLKVYVKNTTNGPKVDQVGIEDKDGAKIDGTPVAPTPGENQTVDESKETAGKFRFVNKYVKTVNKHDEPQNPNPDPNPKDPNNPDPVVKEDPKTGEAGAFELDKYVLGEYGDQTKDFEFTITVKNPTTADADYKALAATNVEGATIDADGKFTLKHDGKLTLKELPVGTKITLVEADYTGQGYKAAKWTTSQSDNGLTILVGENGGYAICRNPFDDTSVTPTGIIINNLPYVLLIAIALGGIVLFTRKRRYE